MKLLPGTLIVILVALALVDLGPAIGISDQLNAILTIFLGLAFTLLHGGATLGKTRLAVFFGITILVSFSSEALGVATGWIFGSYYYTDNLGPKLLGVPPMIQAAYVGMGYASMVMARIILGAEETPRGRNLLAVALCASAIMVAWDLSMDPYQSTVAGDWIWRNGGTYFGVPMHNYLGWFCTVFVFLFLYLKYEGTNPLPAVSGSTASRFFWSLPVIYYFLNALGIALTPVVDSIKPPIASPQNYPGSLDALQQSLTLICVFAMGVPVLIALCRLLPNSKSADV